MTEYKLIKLTEGYIIVSDKEPEDFDWYYNDWCKGVFYNCEKHKAPLELYHKSEYWNYFIGKGTNFKIIASNFIPELPPIDFNGLEEEFGIVDVKKLSKEIFKEKTDKIPIPTSFWMSSLWYYEKCFIDGFNKCLELNKDKLYTLKDLKDAFNAGNAGSGGSMKNRVKKYNGVDEYLQTFLIWHNEKGYVQQIEWNVEVSKEKDLIKILNIVK